MNAPDPYPPLATDHPAVRDPLYCPCCGERFAAGAVTCLWPCGAPDEDNVREGRLLHHECAVKLAADVSIQRARESRCRAKEREPGDEELRETLAIYEHDARRWREYALALERGLPAARPAESGPYVHSRDTRRLDFLEQRIREHGPDLGYLLGLPQGWTNLRVAIDWARACGSPR